jgi:hypothetical protein
MTGSPRLNQTSNTENQGFLRLFLISIFVAAVNAAIMFYPFSLGPIDYFDRFDSSCCASGIWILVVILAVGSYGKRGLWLLIAMPIALYVPIILALAELGWIDPAI